MNKNNDIISSNLLGYALCFNSYSSSVGKVWFMKDLFVRAEYRGFGVGRKILAATAQHARSHQYKRFEWFVLNWNAPAVKFYKAMGAEDMTERDGWNFYRLALK